MESEIEDRVNSEVESLKIQVKLLETELEISRMRAESCEEELRQLKATLRLSAKNIGESTNAPSTSSNIPPPPPPPMFLLNSQPNTFRSRSNSQSLTEAINDAQQKLQHATELKVETKATGRNELMRCYCACRSLPPCTRAKMQEKKNL